ncbi:hypothetical protein HDV01_003444 [Terramyces sp. JEL0728]|nr:hypothetical protein HDV01_003444 [Terramyces sp. JEL0728]
MSFGTISHIMPFLPALQILAEQGNRITFLAPQEYLKHVDDFPGILKRQIGSGSKQWDRDYVRDFKTIKAFDGKQKVDLFLCDFMTPACLDYAHFHKKKIVYLAPLGYLGMGRSWYIPPYGSPFTQEQVVSSLFTRIYKWLTEIPSIPEYIESINQYENYMKTRKELGLDKAIPKDYIGQHLFISHSVFGFHEPRDLPTNVLVVGPVLPSTIDPLEPELLDQLYSFEIKGISVIYISYGSVLDITHFTGLKIFASIVQLLNENPKLAVIIALGGTDPRSYHVPDDLIDRIIIKSWVNQRALLMNSATKLFINHGGLSSIMESMYAGVPMLVTPISADQFDNAKKLVNVNLGVTVDINRITPSNFTSTIKEVMAQFKDPESKLYNGAQRFKKIARLNSQSHLLLLVNTFEMAATVGYNHLVPITAKMTWWQIHGEFYTLIATLFIVLVSIVHFLENKI